MDTVRVRKTCSNCQHGFTYFNKPLNKQIYFCHMHMFIDPNTSTETREEFESKGCKRYFEMKEGLNENQ